MEAHFKLSDEEFQCQFASCQLEPALFSHEAHLRLAWLNIKQCGLVEAEERIQNQILNFVEHVGARDKYHTTLTVAAIRAVQNFIKNSKSDNFKDFILEFPELKNDFKALINRHYSFDIFQSKKAKEEFLEPDLVRFG